MLIAIIVTFVAVCGAGGTGLAVRAQRKRRARTRKLVLESESRAVEQKRHEDQQAKREAEEAAAEAARAQGRLRYPTVKELLKAAGLQVLDVRPRPTPQLHAKIACKAARGPDGKSLRCEFDHGDIYRARNKYWDHSQPEILLLEQVIATGTRAEYRKICRVCDSCLHVYPIESPELEGTVFEHALGDKQSLRDVVSGIDPTRWLEDYRDWLERELGDVRLRLLKAAHAAPGQLDGHPHREHPKLLAASAAEEGADSVQAASKTN